jgi:pimeloyl-ACP methyl ester carboxylesterase
MRAFALLFIAIALRAAQPYEDRSYPSEIFAGPRNYRIFLPVDYQTSTESFPVIYYFHGHSDRYTLEAYDKGLDTVPKIADFVRKHRVIVVAVDGYVALDYTGFYGGSPYDVRLEGGDYDFGENFRELVAHIDSTFRTMTGRRYRATSGLSMGGFMSLWLSARYPDLIGSASSFNPGPEFYVGDKGRRSLWRPKDHVLNHEHSRIRLIRASGDYISQYHEETRAAYATEPTVAFEYRQDEYHRHWATSIGETFSFHSRAFEDAALDTKPIEFNYSSAYRNFTVWNYRVESNMPSAGLILLEHARQGSIRVRTQQWAPDGPAANCSAVSVTTPPLYKAAAAYRIADFSLNTGVTSETTATADSEGRLRFSVDCSGHELSFSGPGTGAQPPVLLPLSTRDVMRVVGGAKTSLPIKIFNPRGTPMENVVADLTSDYPTVSILRGHAEVRQILPSTAADAGDSFALEFSSTEGEFKHARLSLKITYDGYQQTTQKIDVVIVPEDLVSPAEVEILDGRTHTFSVFRQKGNQGGGSPIERNVTEGTGNGNGILEPGEKATIWLKLCRGLDPQDRDNWCRAKVYFNSHWLAEVQDIQETKQREWTGAQNRTSLVELSRKVPPDAGIPVTLDCESYSFYYTPDVRYGGEPLYQAFQLHKHHLFAWRLNARAASNKNN